MVLVRFSFISVSPIYTSTSSGFLSASVNIIVVSIVWSAIIILLLVYTLLPFFFPLPVYAAAPTVFNLRTSIRFAINCSIAPNKPDTK